VRNPLVILLSVLAIITFATAEEPSDYIGGVVILLMVLLGWPCGLFRSRERTPRRPS